MKKLISRQSRKEMGSFIRVRLSLVTQRQSLRALRTVGGVGSCVYVAKSDLANKYTSQQKVAANQEEQTSVLMISVWEGAGIRLCEIFLLETI